MSNPTFLRWAGSKRSLTRVLAPHANRVLNRSLFAPCYAEPFAGSAALFFELDVESAVLGDVMPPLIETYKAVRDDPVRVAAGVQLMADCYNAAESEEAKKSWYYHQRMLFNEAGDKAWRRAARFIFLNRTCFNGLTRFSQSGKYNVPFGYKKRATVPSLATLQRVSAKLQTAEFCCGDFEDTLRELPVGALAYCDPPYDSEDGNGFTGYAGQPFTRDDQARLAHMVGLLRDFGVYVMVSNADTPFIRDLYGKFVIHEITATRSIAARADSRGAVQELLICNFDEQGEFS